MKNDLNRIETNLNSIFDENIKLKDTLKDLS